MNITKFKEIINSLKDSENSIILGKSIGVNLYDFQDKFINVIFDLLFEIYGPDGIEIITWWCYEKNWGTRKDLTMKDKDGNLLCDTIEDLHNWLEENKPLNSKI